VSPKNSNCSRRGTPKRRLGIAALPSLRAKGSSGSKPSATSSTPAASRAVRAKIDTQSSERQAGTTPRVLTRPKLGFRPTKLLNAAGTRPEPAVSVPREQLASPVATATAEPELEPPAMYSALKLLRHAPYGERVPTKPVANWSRLVLPRGIAPASSNRWTTVADRVGVYANGGHAAVVGTPAKSILSLMTKGIPYSGRSSMDRDSSACT
jgi:hypothetical protein